ncbi:MAG: hypothetical protein DWQ47_14190 [Acidobacteria bacterium]|nr:MAG: hypothetical protein DWQ32_01590 [Acidobacteriota bacterium]REK02780.1 MAG: hypothetical protein DWQ38_10545 [Acidobacteriota bacterium]REK13415.1 MAG: hypothetical protein DWQ43_07280 [Acidobacteriota bacterium]REK41409.1 MAG: hypothetical protein DWQ47_14190 [Acidobacteriota bacterium]
MFDLTDFFDFYLSWRLFLGLAITAGVGYGLLELIPYQIPTWAIVVFVVVPGVLLSFLWQLRVDWEK